MKNQLPSRRSRTTRYWSQRAVTSGSVEELQRMCAERRQEIAEQLRQARGDGTLEDNPELLSLLGERAGLERRIAEIEAHLAKAQSSSQPMRPWCKLDAASIFGIRPAETIGL